MATFLARAFDVPAAGGGDRFTDIGSSVHRTRINDVAARGLHRRLRRDLVLPRCAGHPRADGLVPARATGLGG
jgi:hypothetical protein